MYEFLDADGERVTVRSTRTLEMLLTQGRITGDTRFRRAGEDEFSAAGSHPELQGIAAQLGVALTPLPALRPLPSGLPLPRPPPPQLPGPAASAPHRAATPALLPEFPSRALPTPLLAVEATPAAPEPASQGEANPWGVARLSAPRRSTLLSHFNATHTGFARFAVVFGLLVGSSIVGLIVAGLPSTTRIPAAMLMIGVGAGTAWLAGRLFRRKHVFRWQWDSLPLGIFVSGSLLLGGPLGVAYGCSLAILFLKGALPRQ